MSRKSSDVLRILFFAIVVRPVVFFFWGFISGTVRHCVIAGHM